MTRSALLQLLAHPAALTGADVRALEQLAHAFPYCQTAHLLLAKATHDQGSMLASQRLRRAATYATDRTRLRALIELAPVLAESPTTVTEAPADAAPTEALAAPAPTELAPPAPTTPAPSAELPTAAGPPPVEAELPAASLLPAPVESAPAELVSAEPAPATSALPEAELPAQAPPIRPPAEAAARFEFGLADAEPADIVAYQLLELAPEPESAAAAPEPAAPAWQPPAFAGAADVGYAPGEGSRLGFCLALPTDEYSLTTGPAALLPSAQLPPAGEFFAPDALLLAHLAAHQPPVAAAPAPIANDLINSFLQRSPQTATRRRVRPTLPEADEAEQADLSDPSTRAVPDLASESLAKILARQGKTDRAIAVYEQLMTRQPEKAAHFAAQIAALRPPADT